MMLEQNILANKGEAGISIFRKEVHSKIGWDMNGWTSLIEELPVLKCSSLISTFSLFVGILLVRSASFCRVRSVLKSTLLIMHQLQPFKQTIS